MDLNSAIYIYHSGYINKKIESYTRSLTDTTQSNPIIQYEN